jgi:hypothetical protein
VGRFIAGSLAHGMLVSMVVGGRANEASVARISCARQTKKARPITCVHSFQPIPLARERGFGAFRKFACQLRVECFRDDMDGFAVIDTD